MRGKNDDNQREETFYRHERRTRELQIEKEAHDREIIDFFQELDISPEQIAAYLTDPSRFSPETWQHIQHLKNNPQ